MCSFQSHGYEIDYTCAISQTRAEYLRPNEVNDSDSAFSRSTCGNMQQPYSPLANWQHVAPSGQRLFPSGQTTVGAAETQRLQMISGASSTYSWWEVWFSSETDLRSSPRCSALLVAGTFCIKGKSCKDEDTHLEWVRSHCVPSGQQWTLSAQHTACGKKDIYDELGAATWPKPAWYQYSTTFMTCFQTIMTSQK